MTIPKVAYRTVNIDGLDIFYREAGPKDAPAILLLHGFPTSSHMFRNLIPALADEFHLVAPDYPGFGYSSAPPVGQFDYTFDKLADVVEKFTEKVGLKKYTLYVQDYGAPVGYRLAVRHPERVTGLVVQNGNAYDEGLDNDFWKPLKAYWKDRTERNAEPLRKFLTLEATRWQYTHGVRNLEAISPDAWTIDQALLDRPGNQEVQLALFYSYGGNPAQYPRWHDYFRQHQPPTLIVWGKNDVDLPARRGRAVQEGLEGHRVPPARHRPLRPGGRRRPDRRPHAAVHEEARRRKVAPFSSTTRSPARNSSMHYDFTAIPDADVPQAVEPILQHVVATYASEANKTVGVWRAVPGRSCSTSSRTRRRTRSARSWSTSFSRSGASSLSSSAPRSRPSKNSFLPARSLSSRRTSTSTSGW